MTFEQVVRQSGTYQVRIHRKGGDYDIYFEANGEPPKCVPPDAAWAVMSGRELIELSRLMDTDRSAYEKAVRTLYWDALKTVRIAKLPRDPGFIIPIIYRRRVKE